MAMRSDALWTALSSDGEKPVEPMTSAGPPRPAASLDSSAEAWAVEKSMITWQRGSASSTRASSNPLLAWPALAGCPIRAASLMSSRDCTSPAVTWPIRPRAPAMPIEMGAARVMGTGP